MVSQHLTIDILNHVGADLYARTGEGDSRAVIFKVAAGEDSVVINNPVVVARIVKPDNTFTITTAELISGPDEPQEFRFYIPEAASQVSGIGSYDIRIQEDGEENIVYSAQGRFICDDNMLTDEMIESVAEVNGLLFPDDFLTKDDSIAVIDDTVTALDSTWSSDKIADEIDNGIYNVINDNTTSTGTTWSSDKIETELDGVAKHVYSSTERVIGTWIDGKPLYEKTLHFSAPNITNDNSTSDLVHNITDIDNAWVETALYKSVNQGIPRYQNIIGATLFSASESYGLLSTWEVGNRAIYCLTTTYSAISGREFVFILHYTKTI